jgi:hypothetical protein
MTQVISKTVRQSPKHEQENDNLNKTGVSFMQKSFFTVAGRSTNFSSKVSQPTTLNQTKVAFSEIDYRPKTTVESIRHTTSIFNRNLNALEPPGSGQRKKESRELPEINIYNDTKGTDYSHTLNTDSMDK